MKAFKRKLRSRDGASITFALLLFLVCAVVSSVVIVAGTASSGQLSRMAQTDQRYYAVTSAAELLKKVLEGQSVKIVTERVKTLPMSSADGVTYAIVTASEERKATVTTKAYFFDETLPKDEATTLKAYVPPSDVTGEEVDTARPKVTDRMSLLLLDAALTHAASYSPQIVQYAPTEGSGISIGGRQHLKLGFDNRTASDDGKKAELAAMAVDIQEELKSNGTLLFYVYKETTDKAGKKETYTLLLTFKPVVEKSTSKRTVTIKPPVYTKETGQYTRTDQETTTDAATYAWKLESIQKRGIPMTT